MEPSSGNASRFGAWLQEMRRARGLSVKDCAQGAGVVPIQWSRWEAAKSQTNKVETLRKIARVLGASEAETFRRAGLIPPNEAAPLTSYFDWKLREEERPSKEAVAEAAVDLLWNQPERVDEILVNDGSSTYLFAEKYLDRWTNLRSQTSLKVYTNNIQVLLRIVSASAEAIAARGVFPVEVSVAPGKFSPRDRAVRGEQTIAWTERQLTEGTQSPFCILATTGLDAVGGLGTFSGDEDAANLKIPILAYAKRCVILASASKLSRTSEELRRIAAHSEHLYTRMATAWKDLTENATRRNGLWVVSDLDTDVLDVLEHSLATGKHDRATLLDTPRQQQLKNALKLYDLIGDRFLPVRVGSGVVPLQPKEALENTPNRAPWSAFLSGDVGKP